MLETRYKYPVIIKKKIPYLTAAVNGLFLCCLLVTFLSWFFFAPATQSGNEMKTVAALNSMSEGMKWFILSCGAGTVVLYILLKVTLFRVSGFVEFTYNQIILSKSNRIQIISSNSIVGIDFYDSMNATKTKNIFELFIYQKDKINDIRLRLKDYGHAEEVIDQILIYNGSLKNIKEIDEVFESRFENGAIDDT